MNPDLSVLPALPRDEEGPVFRAPWEAQAFGMTLALYERGLFTWKEWADRLAIEIGAVRDRDDGSRYYELWLAALEKLVADKGLVLDPELARRREAWAQAAAETPHGQPIELKRGGG
jgi:nitrile hydratase accessory protein